MAECAREGPRLECCCLWFPESLSVGVSALALRVATEEDKDTRQDLCLAGASLW